ncbi:MAG: FMN-binding protein [Propionibacteriaceae bacterium]|jgi:major membrane immunogen (membrane-anchored lipoprotein)|nr:FMN-binding protein [Propionibacteriaceae bacterium]
MGGWVRALVKSALLASAVIGMEALAGCSADLEQLKANTDVRSGDFADGTYSGVSPIDALGATGEVELTISGGNIVRVSFLVRQADGSVKDSEYGKVGGQIAVPALYEQAQRAVAAQITYAEELEQVDDLGKVDVVTGASISYQSFVAAVADALEKARK